jgi:alkylation response protein AidB-like acyl-CoA dehydrogenase
MDQRAFFQDPPQLANTYDADPALAELLERLLPAEARTALAPEWRALGEQAAGPLMALARQAEAEPPRHVPYDAWGRRVDRIEVSPAWTRLQEEAARWGLFAVPYERALGELARLHQGALLALYAPSSAIASCPLAMTDGAARTLLEHDPELAARVVPRLTTRDPAALWTCGQWMTERTGGSDVGGTLTAARAEGDGTYRLHGSKWFTSAATSDAALTLARVHGAPDGGAGLTLFYLELRRPDRTLNGIRVERLKDKLGTRALPTAELTLEGALARPVGGLGQGVRKVAPLLNTTRLHNAVNACGTMARLLQLLRDYARRRVVFGEPLAKKPLHRETVASLQTEYEAALALTFECLRLLGRVESGAASAAERACLRLLTPVAKLATARQAVAAASEALEGFGGAGYVEDTGLPVWLRDAQVLPIWEGTTNVLSLDVLRAVAREDALGAWAADARARLQALRGGPLADTAAALGGYLDHVLSWFAGAGREEKQALEPAARRFAFAVAALAAGVGLCEQGAWALARGRSERSALAARGWAAARLRPLPDPAQARYDAAARHVLSGLDD